MENQEIARPKAESGSLLAIFVSIAILLVPIRGLEIEVGKVQPQNAVPAAHVLRFGNSASFSRASTIPVDGSQSLSSKEDEEERDSPCKDG